jgi:hypothetical protein
MVLWQGTPHMTILVSKRCFALRNHLVFHFKSVFWGAFMPKLKMKSVSCPIKTSPLSFHTTFLLIESI